MSWLGSAVQVWARSSIWLAGVGGVTGICWSLGNEINGNFEEQRRQDEEDFNVYSGPIGYALLSGCSGSVVGLSLPTLVVLSPGIALAAKLTQKPKEPKKECDG